MSPEAPHSDSADKLATENDLREARQSIVSSSSSQRDADVNSSGRRIPYWIAPLCTVVTTFITIAALIFAIHQYRKTIFVERYGSAETTVVQFIAQVTELSSQAELATQNNIVNDQTVNEHSLLDSFIVSRAQMLIDGDDTGRFAGDIIRFFAATDLGQLIGANKSLSTTDAPILKIDGSVFINASLTYASITERLLNCLGFEQGIFDNVDLRSSSLSHMFLESSKLSNINLEGSEIRNVYFTDVSFYENISFEGATIVNSSFTNSNMFTKNFNLKGASIVNSDFSEVIFSEYAQDAFVKQLSMAKTLYKTKFPIRIVDKLQTELGESKYKAMVETAPVSRYIKSIMSTEQSTNKETLWQHGACPVKRQRDRRI